MGRHDQEEEKRKGKIRLAADLVHVIVGGLILAVITAPMSVKVAMACIGVMVIVACWKAFL